MPLLFAGVIFEGAVIGYDTNIKTGGIGARYLSIGASKQYRIDNIVISLRMVSVVTGEVLIEVLVTKSIYSYGQSQDVFKFIEAGTELVELEGGNTENEGVTLALQRAVETAVVEIVQKGYDKGFWILQEEQESLE
jgi:curli production assembly/transport component CsgG